MIPLEIDNVEQFVQMVFDEALVKHFYLLNYSCGALDGIGGVGVGFKSLYNRFCVDLSVT